MNTQTDSLRAKIGKYLFIFFVFLFLYLPIIIVFVYSFNTSKMNILFEGFTTHWYSSMLHNQLLMEALKNSIIVAFIGTIVSTVIGTLGAVAVQRYQFFGKNFLESVLYIPVVIPEVVLGISLLSVYTAVSMPLSLNTIIIAHITFCIPFVLITVKARLAGLDRSLEEAAMDLGANRFTAFYRVILPLLTPGIASGAMLSITLSLDDVIVSFFTAGPDSQTLPLQIYAMVRTGVTPEVNALFTIIMIVIMIVIIGNTVRQVHLVKKTK
ncbi:MAG: ABC transporter permease subunit [Sporolactobacillus sp.]|jgi:spermidine/putrescine transport system permease protein|nr:ABC transporter permease subunit [Sporolactobacillus sp.]